MPGTTRRQCLNCACFEPDPHKGWSPSEYESEYKIWHLYRYLDDQGYVISNAGWPGKCFFNPEALPVRSNHWCFHWLVNDWMLESLTTWRGHIAARRKVAELRAELKKEKERSVERFRKLHAPAKRGPKGSAREESQAGPAAKELQ